MYRMHFPEENPGPDILEIKNRDHVKETIMDLRIPLFSMIDLARKQDTCESEAKKLKELIKQNEEYGSPCPKLEEKLADQKNNLVMLQRDKEKVQSDIRKLLNLIQNLTYPTPERMKRLKIIKQSSR